MKIEFLKSDLGIDCRFLGYYAEINDPEDPDHEFLTPQKYELSVYEGEVGKVLKCSFFDKQFLIDTFKLFVTKQILALNV
jgi:hypothetical protein